MTTTSARLDTAEPPSAVPRTVLPCNITSHHHGSMICIRSRKASTIVLLHVASGRDCAASMDVTNHRREQHVLAAPRPLGTMVMRLDSCLVASLPTAALYRATSVENSDSDVARCRSSSASGVTAKRCRHWTAIAWIWRWCVAGRWSADRAVPQHGSETLRPSVAFHTRCETVETYCARLLDMCRSWNLRLMLSGQLGHDQAAFCTRLSGYIHRSTVLQMISHVISFMRKGPSQSIEIQFGDRSLNQ